VLDTDIVVGTSSVERNCSNCSGTLSSMASNAIKDNAEAAGLAFNSQSWDKKLVDAISDTGAYLPGGCVALPRKAEAYQ
jgi:hypothetical protein